MARKQVWQMDLMDDHRAGRITDEQLHSARRIGRRVLLIKHSCGQYVLRGLDADRCALTVLADPYPLSALGEVGALGLGRPTYYLHRGELEPRDRWNIPGHLPSHDLLVVAAHDCTPMRADWLLGPAPKTPAPAPTTEESF